MCPWWPLPYTGYFYFQVAAPAKAGALAPIDVFVPPQNTGLGPEKTSFFQALSIATKISKGTIEILGEVHLIKKEDKVGFSEATLLQMLKVFPFSYGLRIRHGELWGRGVSSSDSVAIVICVCTCMWEQCMMVAPCFLPTFWILQRMTCLKSLPW